MAQYRKILQLGALIVFISALICCDRHDTKPAPKIDPLLFKSATELTGLIRRGEITSLNLLNLYLNIMEVIFKATTKFMVRQIIPGIYPERPAVHQEARAAGFTPLELGSDLGGSIRFPAHYTGVFGHKTTFGIVPRYGHIPPMPGQVSPYQMPMIPLLVVGPLARSADDLELALKVLTTPGSMDKSGQRPQLLPPRRKRFSDYRVAVWYTDSSPAAEIDAEVLKILRKTVEKLRGAGLEIDEKARPDFHLWESLHLWGNIRDQLIARELPLYEQLAARQKKQQAKWAAFFERYDVLLAPVSLTVAFPHDHKEPIIYRRLVVNGKKRSYSDNLAWTAMAIVSGLPATVAPVGVSESGLPIGIQIIGARFEDLTTIAFARGLSELVGGFVAPPGYKD